MANVFRIIIIKSRSLLEKIARIFHFRFFYCERCGIKAINCLHIDTGNWQDNATHLLKISKKRIYLGFDFLKDEYSFIDTPLLESPHYKLMKEMFENKCIDQSEYIHLLSKGRLDERREINSFDIDKKRMSLLFEKRCEEVKSDSYKPVMVFKANNGKFYIVDGKHRAALASLFCDSIKCVVVDFDTFYSFINKRLLPKINNKKYNKHYLFIKRNYKNVQ